MWQGHFGASIVANVARRAATPGGFSGPCDLVERRLPYHSTTTGRDGTFVFQEHDGKRILEFMMGTTRNTGWREASAAKAMGSEAGVTSKYGRVMGTSPR